MEKNLGSGIQWFKVPSVKAVMKAMRRRIASSVTAALPEQPAPADGELAAEPETAAVVIEPASPYLAKVCRELIERLGAEKAVEALVSLSYGALLDPARYGPITEFSEEDFNDAGKATARGFAKGMGKFAGRIHDDRRRKHSPREMYQKSGGGGPAGDFARVYVGQGRQHGLGARDIAALLMRAGGVPGRLVDEIEMKDYCSFATLPADAARRACTFSRTGPQEPVIRLARAPEHAK
jgi:ATP-dependent RNA helicase DeaD